MRKKPRAVHTPYIFCELQHEEPEQYVADDYEMFVAWRLDVKVVTVWVLLIAAALVTWCWMCGNVPRVPMGFSHLSVNFTLPTLVPLYVLWNQHAYHRVLGLENQFLLLNERNLLTHLQLHLNTNTFKWKTLTRCEDLFTINTYWWSGTAAYTPPHTNTHTHKVER